MPDPNKFLKLKEINYAIKPCCALCIYGRFSPNTKPASPFGECMKHTYQHEKHSSIRGVSIVLMSVCDDVELGPTGPMLGAHTTFLQKKKE